jgi:hypothetical protein
MYLNILDSKEWRDKAPSYDSFSSDSKMIFAVDISEAPPQLQILDDFIIKAKKQEANSKKLQEDMINLNELTKNFYMLVREQGEMVNIVTDNIHKTLLNVDKGGKVLETVSHDKCSLPLFCIHFTCYPVF